MYTYKFEVYAGEDIFERISAVAETWSKQGWELFSILRSNMYIIAWYRKEIESASDNDIAISTKSNGAVLNVPDDDGNGRYEEVFKYDEMDLEGLIDMLYELLIALGYGGGKYEKERIEIRVVHGSKYECEDKDCKICKEVY